ncbi:M56 family metallopeptidase [Dactylosporangium sp. NPDC005572]|uniref:M56 family metallopeptidase n=1 Tax=Dactylosporangium sp. NPDC005572 TaxID=3156889 RepID=UPI0033B84089
MSPLLLLAFGALLATTAAPRLAAAGWAPRAPRLAVLAWIALSGAVLLSAVLAALTLLLYWDRTHDLVNGAWHFCLDALTGRLDRPAQVLAGAGLLGLCALAGRMTVSAVRMLKAQRTRRTRLRLAVRLGAVPSAVPGASVVRHDEPAAYLMPGRTRPGRAADIVITSAAVERLEATELEAVLAHERAHHAGRHYELTHWMRLLAHAFPRIRCFQVGRRQVDRLVEMCADDAAARSTSRIDVARALVTMAQPAPGIAGEGLLAMHGSDRLERLHRLLTPPAPLPVPARLLIPAGAALAVAAPPLLAMFDRYAGWLPTTLFL